MTPVFGVLAISLTLVAIGSTQLARTQERASRRAFERVREQYVAEGVANIAAWRLMREVGVPTLSWTEATREGPLRVIAEPEARKLSLSEVTGPRGRARLVDLLGAAEAEGVEGRLLGLASDEGGAPTRSQILTVSASRAWAECGLTLVSASSRLTDNALTPPSPPEAVGTDLRAGEVWRLNVSRGDRVILDRVVRFTGDDREPVAVIDQLSPGSRTPLGCVDRVGRGRATG